MRRTTFGRLASVLVLVAAVVVAVALVSTPLTDHSTDCGTAIDSAVHGVRIPRSFLHPTEPTTGGQVGIGPHELAVVCRNVARERIAESAAVIALAVVGVDLARRRRSGPAPKVVTAPT